MADTVHPLNLQRFGQDGWFFLSCEAVPGVNLFGPDLDELIDSAEIAIAELMKARGDNVIRVEITTVPEDGHRAPAWGVPTRHLARALHGELAA